MIRNDHINITPDDIKFADAHAIKEIVEYFQRIENSAQFFEMFHQKVTVQA